MAARVKPKLFHVRIRPKLYLTNVVTQTICSGEAFNLTPESYAPSYWQEGVNYSFNWSRQTVNGISNVANTGTTGLINEVLENTSTISQTVIYEYNLDGGSCLSQGSFSVIVSPRPSPYCRR